MCGKEKVWINHPAGEHSRLVDKVEKEEKVAKEGLFDSRLKSLYCGWTRWKICWKITMVRL